MSGRDSLSVSPGDGLQRIPFNDLSPSNTVDSLLQQAPAGGIGPSSKLTAIKENVISGAGSITRGLGQLFRGGAYLVNGVIGLVAFVVMTAAHIPGYILGGGLALIGAVIGGVLGSFTSKDGGALAGAAAGCLLGYNIGKNGVLFVADLPFIIPRLAVIGVMGGIGSGLALLGGTDIDEVEEQMTELFTFSIIAENLIRGKGD